MGGAELVSLRLAEELERRGHDVAIAALFVDPAGLPDIARSRRYVLPWRWIAARLAASRKLSMLLGTFVMLGVVARASRGVDLLNPHNLPGPVVSAIVGPLRRIPVVWTINEVPVPLPAEQARQLGLVEAVVWQTAAILSRWAARVPSEIVVLDEKTRRSVRQHYGRDATVAMPGLDLAPFSAARSTARRANAVPNLLFVGKLHPQKNPTLAVETVAELRRRGRMAVLTIVGAGPLRPQLDELAAAVGIASAVTFRSGLSVAELAGLYAQCDVLLVTPTGHQAWGLTPFEALASGTAAVVSDQAGAAEVLAEHDAALVAPPTAQAFADQVETLLDNPQRAAALVANGDRLLREELTWKRYGDRYERLFRGVLERGR
jgi:glycosyltransferase involved in cell wall biosynthesis